LLHNDRKGLVNGLILTVGLGIIFSSVQAYDTPMLRSPSKTRSMARRSSWRLAFTGSMS
jgi:heme/copper-type cytochrome/quinol oxidase subunit 3